MIPKVNLKLGARRDAETSQPVSVSVSVGESEWGTPATIKTKSEDLSSLASTEESNGVQASDDEEDDTSLLDTFTPEQLQHM